MANRNIATWRLEIHRLCAALNPRRAGHVVSLGYGPVADTKPLRHGWIASCGLGSAEARTPDLAMETLVDKLKKRIDDEIEARRQELVRLRAARTGEIN